MKVWKKILLFGVIALAALALPAAAQVTSTLNVTIGAEALLISATNTNLTQATTFGNFTGSTNLTYKLRTGKAAGSTATISVKFTDFATGGPQIARDLTYLATSTKGTAATGQVPSTATAKPVLTFGNNVSTASTTDTINWTLLDDATVETGTYSAVATFTISLT